MHRTLYIIAYDITEPKRLQRVRYFLKGYSTGGQKSVYECFLTEGQLRYVLSVLNRLIYEEEDRVHVFKLEGHSRVWTLGVALPPQDPQFFFIG
ncbi:MAG: CRISPR-associated endonuclease Cas2 [Nitrospirae bacterium]|nr:MAG: CRISPR-associated endonuclease Cas2 [Nitrospirota bacterium]